MSTKKKGKNTGVKIFLLFLAVLFVCVFAFTEVKIFNTRRANESFDQVDFHSMAEFSAKNSEKVIKALRSGNLKKLTKLVGDEAGAEEVMRFADWRNANFDTALSYGAGSLSTEADKKGRIDVAERIVVQAGETKYMFYIETLTSRWGRKNEGVSAVGVTTYSHYNELDSSWNGEKDDESALAGTLFRESGSGEESSKQAE